MTKRLIKQDKKVPSKKALKKVSKKSSTKPKSKKPKKEKEVQGPPPEIEGLVVGEQELFYYGPPPALRILNKRNDKFDRDFHPQDLLRHMQEGSSRSEICAGWGITYSKFNEWLDDYPEFAEAYAVGKPAYDGYYKRALRHSAFGQMKTVREGSLFFMLKNVAGFGEQGGDHEFQDSAGSELEFVDGDE